MVNSLITGTPSMGNLSLGAAGLIALADLGAIPERTALTGTASFFDIFFLAPGIHTQQNASNINSGELPTCAAMTTGYIFRIENPATVYFLQKVGEPGSLVTLCVKPQSSSTSTALDTYLYPIGVALTMGVVSSLIAIADVWALSVLFLLSFSRLLNTIVIKRRSQMRWKGALEPGVNGDLLVLLSQDRWVRIQGTVDDLKAVTSGQWLRDETAIERFVASLAKLLVYLSAGLATNSSELGRLLIVGLLVASGSILGLWNNLTHDLCMYGRKVHVLGKAKKYNRRLEMGEELVEELGRDDWAISLGLIQGSNPAKVTP